MPISDGPLFDVPIRVIHVSLAFFDQIAGSLVGMRPTAVFLDGSRMLFLFFLAAFTTAFAFRCRHGEGRRREGT